MSSFVELSTFYNNLKQNMQPANNQVGHFNMFKIEDLLLPSHKPVNYTRRNFYKISLVTGHSLVHYADQSHEVYNHTLVFTNPMIPYKWEIIGHEQSGYMCIFTEDFLSGVNSIKNFPAFQPAGAGIISLNADEFELFNSLFLKMYTELQGGYAYKYDLLRNQLMEVIHEGQKLQPAQGSPAIGSNAFERITALFAELLERQFPVELSNQVIKLNTPSAFAQQLNIHVNHLNKALKETTGQTTSQLISSRILQEAKILLKSTNWTINEIAWSLGFEEPNHFSGFFKNKEKLTPKQFRANTAD